MIKKLIEKRAAYKKQLDDLLGKAKTEERAMTPEETAEFDRIEGEIKNIDKTIDAEKRAMSLDDFHPLWQPLFLTQTKPRKWKNAPLKITFWA